MVQGTAAAGVVAHLAAEADVLSEPVVDPAADVEAVRRPPAEEVRVAAGDERLDFVIAGLGPEAANSVQGECAEVPVILELR